MSRDAQRRRLAKCHGSDVLERDWLAGLVVNNVLTASAVLDKDAKASIVFNSAAEPSTQGFLDFLQSDCGVSFHRKPPSNPLVDDVLHRTPISVSMATDSKFCQPCRWGREFVIFRSLFLYLIGIKGFFRKLRFDWGRELVVGLSAVVLGSLFYYVFNDFINTEVASLSQAMRDSFAHFLGWVLIAGASIGTGRSWRDEFRGKHTVAGFSRWLGDAPTIPQTILILRLVTLAAGWSGLTWILIHRMALLDVSPGLAALTQMLSLGVSSLFLLSWGEKALASNVQPDSRSPMARMGGTSFYALVNWRFELTARRLRDARLSLGAAGLCLLFLGYLGFRNAPPPAMVAVAFVIGAFIAAAVSLALSADLRAAWIERSSGISHEEYITAWQWVAWGLGLGGGLLVVAINLAPKMISLEIEWTNISEALKLATLTALMPLLFPSLMLQIDGRRPFAQIMAMLLIGMFVGTAIYAHWAGLILVPVVHSYANGLQNGRFYRA